MVCTSGGVSALAPKPLETGYLEMFCLPQPRLLLFTFVRFRICCKKATTPAARLSGYASDWSKRPLP